MRLDPRTRTARWNSRDAPPATRRPQSRRPGLGSGQTHARDGHHAQTQWRRSSHRAIASSPTNRRVPDRSANHPTHRHHARRRLAAAVRNRQQSIREPVKYECQHQASTTNYLLPIPHLGGCGHHDHRPAQRDLSRGGVSCRWCQPFASKAGNRGAASRRIGSHDGNDREDFRASQEDIHRSPVHHVN